MIAKARLACLPFLAFATACASATSGVTPPGASATGAFGDTVSRLTVAVLRSRARLDSAVGEIHRVSGDTSSSAVAQSRQLKRRELSLDSAYRMSIVELESAISASIAGLPMSGTRVPIEPLPAPFVRAFSDGSNWMLQSPLIHEFGKDGRFIVIVPRGFVTDFASIPPLLQTLRGVRPTTERYGIAAVVHDYLYWRQDCTREESDNIMSIAMKEAGVSFLERSLIYQAVRTFGQSAWDGNKRARESGLVRTVAPPNDHVPPTGTWSDYREWLRTARAKEGVEYPVHRSVCAMADSASTP